MSEKSKKSQPKVSIVVPIYGVEKYLAECLDSILAQTLSEIEIILVDDGSPDNSGKIADDYAKKDSRITVIHQKNGGYGAAVNTGLAKVHGEFTAIVEPDDIIEPDMYEELVASAEKYKTDVTKGMFWNFNSYESGRARNALWRNAQGIDLLYAPSGAFRLTDWPKIIGFHASVWSCVYRTEFIKRNHIEMNASSRYYQDFPWMVETMCKAKRISVVKKPFYHWRNEPDQNNSTNTKTQKNGAKLILQTKMTRAALDTARETGVFDAVKEPLMVHALWANYGFFMNIEPDWQEKYFNALREIFAPLRDDQDFKWRYFTSHEKQFTEAILHESWMTFKRKMFLRRVKSGLKNRLKRVAFAISPSYKAINFIKAQNFDLTDQNNQLRNQIDELVTKIDEMVKK